MFGNKARFTVGIVIVIVAIAWFAWAGFNEGKAYYKTIEEVDAMDESAMDKRLRVAGIVREGSIVRSGVEVTFELEQETLAMSVHYTGSQPIPDTFKGGVEAVVEGHRLADGTFEADHIQAKCASKYEAEYGDEASHETETRSY